MEEALFEERGRDVKAIEIKKLTKSYGKARGIVALDLEVEAGEFFGFIGPNGAGKSTTIRTLLGLLRADSGSASVFGKDVSSQKEEILREVGYLPSEAVFYTGMRVKDVLRLSAELCKKPCKEEAERLCERLELDTAKRVEELSFGNRKKVGIVCALQHQPRLCVLDEPTSGLDPLMQREFFSILEERNKAGMTVFLSSHVLSEIQRHCSRAAIIRDGRVIACDSVEKLSQTSAKRVLIQGRVDLSPLSGLRDIQTTEHGVSFLYGGDINLLLQALAKQRLEDISIAEPDLEEIFLHYYSDGGEKQ